MTRLTCFAVLVLAMVLGSCSVKKDQAAPLEAAAPAVAAPEAGTAEAQPKEVAVVETKRDESRPQVVVETTMGTMKIELRPDLAPETVKNFVQYVQDGFFDGLIFHRVVPGFVIQGGGYDPTLTEKATRAAIKNEAATGLGNRRGTVAMARTQDRHSATSQFFVNLRDNAMLDYTGEFATGFGYCAFGEVIEGMDVVDAIGNTKTGRKPPFPSAEVPLQTVLITRAYLVETPAAE